MGTTLRGLEQAIPKSANISLDYIAVEKDPDCRSVISRVFHQGRLARPESQSLKTSRPIVPNPEFDYAGPRCHRSSITPDSSRESHL
eukprot:scaffold42_cov432-Pavlova_lutheri.AAC.2